MVLKEKNEDKCPWDFRGDEVTNPTVNFAICNDCPFLIEMRFFGEASDEKTHSVIVKCGKGD